MPYAAPVPVFNWTGFYGGLNAGYSFGGSNGIQTVTTNLFSDDYSSSTIPDPNSGLSASGLANAKNSGFIGGIQFGYNYQFNNNFVAGFETDIQGSGIRGRSSFANSATWMGDIDRGINGDTSHSFGSGHFETSVDWLGTVRGRLGYLYTPKLLLYGTGGHAYGHVSVASHMRQQIIDDWNETEPTPYVALPSDGEYNKTRVGWTLGGGFEWMFASNLSVKTEYLYLQFGIVDFFVA
jgi:outer membrane immunogenic protein